MDLCYRSRVNPFCDNSSDGSESQAQWQCHRLMAWKVMGSHLGTGFNPERLFFWCVIGPMLPKQGRIYIWARLVWAAAQRPK